jgi:hypothetical protein
MPKQLLIQPFSAVIRRGMNPKVQETLMLMWSGQSAKIVEFDCKVMTDNEQQLPINMTILGISNRNSHTKSCIIILWNEMLLNDQRELVDLAKEQSDKLLYKILPRNIVTRLNQDECNITIVIPSATIIFIDILKFNEYVANLAPAQIIENLSIVFDTFDKICSRFDHITKIKLIGDIYMAAGRLFSERQPTDHAHRPGRLVCVQRSELAGGGELGADSNVACEE